LGGVGDLAGLGGIDAYGAEGYDTAYDPARDEYAGDDAGLGSLGGLGEFGSLLPAVGTLLGGGLGIDDSLLGGLGGGGLGQLAGLGGVDDIAGAADGMMTGYDDYAGYEADPQATLTQALLPALLG
jgi:hypothetical protein